MSWWVSVKYLIDLFMDFAKIKEINCRSLHVVLFSSIPSQYF